VKPGSGAKLGLGVKLGPAGMKLGLGVNLGLAGVKLGLRRGLPKLKPHASQNWPDLTVPHLGQGSSPLTAWSARCAPALADRPAAGVIGVTGASARRMPHTSQKSSLTESWPLGHTVIATSPRILPLSGFFPYPDRLGRPGVQGHLVNVGNLLLQPDRPGFHIDDVHHLSQQLGRVLIS